MDLITRIRPVEHFLSAFNVGFALLWLGAVGRVSFAPGLVVLHGAAALLPALFARVRPGARGLLGTLRDVFPLVLVALGWTEMGLVREFLHAAAHDRVVAGVDLLVFGRHLQSVWMPAMPQVWFSELMFGLYVIYYPMVFGAPVALFLLGRREAARRIASGIAVAFLGCYVLYALFPVDGPSHTMARYVGPLAEGFFYRLSTNVLHTCDSMGTAFPSSHVVGAVSMAILAKRWLPKGLAVVFGIEALGVVLSTVYTQNHFAIDSAAGVLLAFGIQLIAVPALEAAPRARPAELPVPPLPIHAIPQPERAGR
jgi:membrane-associated phospholipid phosphatase